jgi:Ca2+:H+ antiporter
MNKSHPFGLPIWKPALYKKSRSVVRKANKALHSSPSSSPELFLNPGNILWVLLFGWWLTFIVLVLSLIMSVVPSGGLKYALVLRELAVYLLWPFGRYVERQVDITPSQVGSSPDEETGLMDDGKYGDNNKSVLERLVAIIKLGPAGCVYYLLFALFIG